MAAPFSLCEKALDSNPHPFHPPYPLHPPKKETSGNSATRPESTLRSLEVLLTVQDFVKFNQEHGQHNEKSQAQAQEPRSQPLASHAVAPLGASTAKIKLHPHNIRRDHTKHQHLWTLAHSQWSDYLHTGRASTALFGFEVAFSTLAFLAATTFLSGLVQSFVSDVSSIWFPLHKPESHTEKKTAAAQSPRDFVSDLLPIATVSALIPTFISATLKNSDAKFPPHFRAQHLNGKYQRIPPKCHNSTSRGKVFAVELLRQNLTDLPIYNIRTGLMGFDADIERASLLALLSQNLDKW